MVRVFLGLALFALAALSGATVRSVPPLASIRFLGFPVAVLAGFIVGRCRRPILAAVLSGLIATVTFDLALLLSSHGGGDLSSARPIVAVFLTWAAVTMLLVIVGAAAIAILFPTKEGTERLA